jgi:exosortase A
MQHTAPVRAKQTTDTEIVRRLALDSAAKASATPDVSATTQDDADSKRLRGPALWTRSWRRSSIIFALCSLLLIWTFRAEIDAAVEVWRSSFTFGHCAFVFPITLFLFYRLRHRLSALQPGSALWAFVPLVGATLLWTIGELTNAIVIKQFAFVVAWQSLFVLIFGWQVSKASLFPLAYVYLAVPFGISAIPALQHIAAKLVVSLLRITGVPVFIDGFRIEIPGGSFLVAEACSGMRYLIVCVALGVLFAYMFFRSWPKRLLFVGLSLIVPIIVNGMRAYGIVMMGYLGRYDIVDAHAAYGLAFMSVAMLALLAVGTLLRDGGNVWGADMVGAPDIAGHTPAAPGTRAGGGFIQIASASMAMAMIVSVHMWVLHAKTPPAGLQVVIQAPAIGHGWIAESGVLDWSPAFQGTDAALQQGYRRAGERVDLHVGYYAYQRESAEAVSDLNTISGRLDLKVLSSRQMTFPIGGISLPINEYVIVYNDREFVVWAWYWVGGHYTNSRQIGKLLEMKAFVTGGERAAAVIAVSAEVSENAQETTNLLGSFLQETLGRDGTLFTVGDPEAGAGLVMPNAAD